MVKHQTAKTIDYENNCYLQSYGTVYSNLLILKTEIQINVQSRNEAINAIGIYRLYYKDQYAVYRLLLTVYSITVIYCFSKGLEQNLY